MKGVDYTKALSRERDNMQNTIQKDRAYTEKRIKDEQEIHAAAQKKQRDVYERDRARLESSHQKSLESIKENTSELTDAQKSRFHENLESERDRFLTERNKMSKDFDSRFRNIQDSYARNHDSQEKQHKSLEENQQNRYEKNVSSIVKDKDQKVKQFQDRMIGAGANLRDEHGREKAAMARQNESRVENLYKEESDKRFALKEQLQGDLHRVRDTQQKELEQLQEYNRDKVKNLSESFNRNASGIANDYSAKNDEIVAKQSAEDHQRTKEHQTDITELRRGYDKDLRNATIEARRRDNGSGEFAEVAKRQQGKDETRVLEDRVEHLQDALAEKSRDYSDRRSEDADKNSEMFLKQSVEAANRIEKQGRTLTADKIVSMTNEREKATKLQTQQEATMLSERNRYEHQILSNKNDSNKKILELKENFNESLKRLEENNQKYVQDTRKSTDEEKREFIINNQKERSQEISDIRRNFNLLMDGTVATYEQRLDEQTEHNKRLKQELDQKVAFVRDDAEQRVQQQTELYTNKRDADLKAAQENLDRREAEFKKQIRELSSSYTSKMDKQQYNSEIRIKHLTKNYENQLKTQAQAHAKQMAETKARTEFEMDRLNKLHESQKAQIIAQYDNELTQAKHAHLDATERLNDYKNMG